MVAGSGGYQATGVGAEAYARKLAAQARRFTVVRSELVAGINQILRYVTWALPPVAVLVVVSQLSAPPAAASAPPRPSPRWSAWSPQGLVLLTSIAFGAAAVTLARRRVLVQQLPAVEGLARVDVVCLDKTGTLTDGAIAFDSLIRLDEKAPAEAALGALAGDQARNATLAAIGQAFPAAAGVGAPGRRAVLLRPQVERRQLRRARHLGTGSTGNGAARRHRTGCCHEPPTWPPAGGGSSRWLTLRPP